jgi:hypothetical protein
VWFFDFVNNRWVSVVEFFQKSKNLRVLKIFKEPWGLTNGTGK